MSAPFKSYSIAYIRLKFVIKANTRFGIIIDSRLCILYNLDGRAYKLSFQSEQAFVSQGCSQVFDVAIKTAAIHAERLNSPGLFLLITQNRSTSIRIGVYTYK